MTGAPPADVRILLQGIVGSRAYGMARPDSDIDQLGIFVAPTVEFLGLRGKPETETYTTTNPDVTLHEVGKFARLALACNPTILELLWLPLGGYTGVIDDMAGDLINDPLRTAFLSAERVRATYLGYAYEQFQRMVRIVDGVEVGRRERMKKNARHVYRLLQQGLGLYATGELVVRLADPDAALAFGERAVADPDLVMDTLWDFEGRFDKVATPLPERPDTKRVEKWLVSLREGFL